MCCKTKCHINFYLFLALIFKLFGSKNSFYVESKIRLQQTLFSNIFIIYKRKKYTMLNRGGQKCGPFLENHSFWDWNIFLAYSWWNSRNSDIHFWTFLIWTLLQVSGEIVIGFLLSFNNCIWTFFPAQFLKYFILIHITSLYLFLSS